MPKPIILVVDMQNALIWDNPYNIDKVILGIGKLINFAREQNIEIIYIQHDGGEGNELEKGTNGWEIDNRIAPMAGDRVFEKNKNSAFKNTDLHVYLQEKKADTIILVGMQTEYCIDATCKSAFDLDYSVIIPEKCTTTFDNDYFNGKILSEYYEKKIWNGRFAEVMPAGDVIIRFKD